MYITRSRSPVITYLLNDQALEVADSHPYLGVTISSDLRPNKHCHYVVNESTKILNFISRNFLSLYAWD